MKGLTAHFDRREEKGGVRSLVFQLAKLHSPQKWERYLGLPQRGACVEEGVRQGCFSDTVEIIAVERDKATANQLRDRLAKHVPKGTITVEHSELTDVYIFKQSLDFAFLDLMGTYPPNFADWMTDTLIPGIAPGGSFAITVGLAHRAGRIMEFAQNTLNSPCFSALLRDAGIENNLRASAYKIALESWLCGYSHTGIEYRIYADEPRCPMLTMWVGQIQPTSIDVKSPLYQYRLRMMNYIN
jgi:hypothetical protein